MDIAAAQIGLRNAVCDLAVPEPLIQINAADLCCGKIAAFFEEDVMIFGRGILVGLISVLPVTAFAQEFGPLLPDVPTKTADIEAVCTGVGLDARQNPAWAAYPLKIEVAGRGGQYLGDVYLVLSQKDKTLATLTCGGPWILFRVPAGRYQVEARTEGRTVSSAAFVPATGQSRIILRFPELGGEMSPPSETESLSSTQSAGQ